MPMGSHRNPVNVGIPVDVPAIESPDRKYRESDWHGSAKHLTVEPGSTETSRKKGDLGMRDIPNFEPKPLSHGGKPFKLAGGK